MQYFTTSQAATYLGVTPSRVRQLALAKTITPQVSSGNVRLYTREQLDSYSRRRQRPGNQYRNSRGQFTTRRKAK